MYKLKTAVRRSTLLGAASALLVATIVPSALVLAQQALNPLTERSLLLSSSAPGYIDTDGSGNSYAQRNASGAHYAPAGSGPNGKKTGQTFTFRASSSSTDIEKLTLQYCTTAAGQCQAPGNNAGSAQTSDRETNAVGHAKADPNKTSDFDVVGAFTEGDSVYSYVPGTPVLGTESGGGSFEVLVGPDVDNLTPVSGWTFASSNVENSTNPQTGKMNFITLSRTTGATINNGQVVQVVFRPNENVYMTNPGDDEFFVKINTLDSSDNVVNGGVTVANVMTDSIHISTKVLETMAFSVGTKNPDMDATKSTYGTCDAINVNERIEMGNPDAEYSLSARQAYDANSYWRLSSNSSGGATVYYSGYTLSNTVGDEIAHLQDKDNSLPGTEQFGLGFVNVEGTGELAQDFVDLVGAPDSRYRLPDSFPFITTSTQTGAPWNTLAAQATSADYRDATGTLQTDDNGSIGAGTAQFKFRKSSLTEPEPIAQQNETVISCATAKMRYVANVAADTPAGVYTTKINYLAAPQY